MTHKRTFLFNITALFLGTAFGYFLNESLSDNYDLVDNLISLSSLIGKDIFIGSIYLIAPILIFCSIVLGINKFNGTTFFKKYTLKTFTWFFFSTFISISIGIILVTVWSPGTKDGGSSIRKEREDRILVLKSEYDDYKSTNETFNDYLQFRDMDMISNFNKTVWSTISKTQDQTFLDMLRTDFFQPIFTNPVNVFSQKSPLAVIIFAIIIGIACLSVGESSELFISFLGNLNSIVERITEKIIVLSPIPIFFLSLEMTLAQGLESVSTLGSFILCFIVAIFFHLIFLFSVVKFKNAGSFLDILKEVKTTLVVAFSTSSSIATLPLTLKEVTKNLGTRQHISNLVVPLGANFNKNGTSMYLAMSVLFVAQIYSGLDDFGVNLGFSTLLLVAVTSFIGGIIAAGVPGGGLITMALIASTIGLPLYYLPLVYAIDHFMDHFRTFLNVLGDVVGSVLINKKADSE